MCFIARGAAVLLGIVLALASDVHAVVLAFGEAVFRRAVVGDYCAVDSACCKRVRGFDWRRVVEEWGKEGGGLSVFRGMEGCGVGGPRRKRRDKGQRGGTRKKGKGQRHRPVR